VGVVEGVLGMGARVEVDLVVLLLVVEVEGVVGSVVMMLLMGASDLVDVMVLFPDTVALIWSLSVPVFKGYGST
jgi:hypothetical protein